MVSNRGAIRIFEKKKKKKSGKYVGGVGIEEEGHQILVPWQERWRFRASAVVEVGYIKAKGTLDV